MNKKKALQFLLAVTFPLWALPHLFWGIAGEVIADMGDSE